MLDQVLNWKHLPNTTNMYYVNVREGLQNASVVKLLAHSSLHPSCNYWEVTVWIIAGGWKYCMIIDSIDKKYRSLVQSNKAAGKLDLSVYLKEANTLLDENLVSGFFDHAISTG